MSMSRLSKHEKPLTKQPKQISLWQKVNYTRNWADFPCLSFCLHTGSYIQVFVWAMSSLYSLDLFLEKKHIGVQRSKNKTWSLRLQFIWDLFSRGGLLRGEVKGRSDLERTQFPEPCPPTQPPCPPLLPSDSLIRVTQDSWVKPTLMRGIGL